VLAFRLALKGPFTLSGSRLMVVLRGGSDCLLKTPT
jgi:hypothetical protein